MTSIERTTPAGYEEAHAAVAHFDRSHRTRLVVSGRAPGQMLGGVVSGRIPAASEAGGATGTAAGQRHYSTVLTPKGRMLSDLYLIRLPGDDERFLLDVSAAGREALLGHFKRVLPPRLAKVDDVSESIGHTFVVGPTSGTAVAAALNAAGANAASVDALAALDVDCVWFGDSEEGTPCVVRSADATLPGYDLFYPAHVAAAVEEALIGAGSVEGNEAAWQTLRIEAGTPEFGTDMTEDTIPIEAGIEQRAIDGSKGCYTGQEVIIRILHRGHVNQHLRTLRATNGGSAPPSVGNELFVEGSEKSVGRVTSVAFSGQIQSVVALGYVRREVDLGTEVRAEGVGGPSLKVLERGPAS